MYQLYQYTKCSSVPTVPVYQPYQCTNRTSVPTVPVYLVYQLYKCTKYTRLPTVPGYQLYQGTNCTTAPSVPRYVSEPEGQKVSKYGKFWTGEHSIYGNFKILRSSQVAKCGNFGVAKIIQFKHLPTLAIPIISNQVAKYGKFGMTTIQFWLLQIFTNFGNTYY